MNVLLLEYDLYKSVGGGQTVYKRLIASNPDITFHYLGLLEAADAERPPNARRVPFKEAYRVEKLKGEFTDFDMPRWAYDDFLDASNIAASVAHLQIDVVDVPDYRTTAYMLAPAFSRHGQKGCRIALALHGNLSETQRVNWGRRGEIDICQDQREQWQYRAADIRYGLSRDYLDHWQAIGGRAGHYLNPLRFVAPPAPVKWNRKAGGISLNFIGRTEGFKGPDLFLELLAWLPPDSFRVARIIGPECVDKNKVSSQEHLRRMAETRGLKVEQHAGMTTAELAGIFADRGVTVLPSRMDTFNLTALESLYAGCPVAVSEKAGVCRFLRETYPNVPFTTLDVDRIYDAAPALRQLIDDYDRQRDLLEKAITSAAPAPTGPTLRQIYESGEDHEEYLRWRASDLHDRAESFHRRHRAPSVQPLTVAGVRACTALRFHSNGLKTKPLDEETDHWVLCQKLFYKPERTTDDLNKKTEFCAMISARSRVDRARVWSELARLERARGNDFVAATYDIRVMRMMGGDRTGMLPVVVSDLREHGYPKEAEAALALYGPRDQRLVHGRALLEGAYAGHRNFSEEPFEFVEDGRGGRQPRVSIIVSLYRAENKFEAFLRILARQPWVRDGHAELVLIDSHSPTGEHAVFKRVAEPLGIKAVYARTGSRETIQKAWNRGILLARAPYLTFLGVDEMVRPHCLSTLAGELDADPGLDWVQGNSVITEVNGHGTPQRDVMQYHRIPYAQDLAYLETCYLSWVGGMYRKSIHDRFGYYDATFGAAGDTEFKNRILPFIRSKTLPMTLGVFLNYPEERTTQSPRAEVEDLRAWYLHRSEAGVEYAFARRGTDEALALFRQALAYRKSYCGHVSSDLDYAAELASYVSKRAPSPQLSSCAAAVDRVVRAYRELDWLPAFSPRAADRQQKRVAQIADADARLVQTALAGCGQLVWRIFNDNRHEQHACVWPAPLLASRHLPDERAHWLRLSLASNPPAGLPDRQSGQAGANEPENEADLLRAAMRRECEKYQTLGRQDLVRDIGKVAHALQALAAGDKPPALEGTDAGSLVCAVLAECQSVWPGNLVARFDKSFADLCALLAKIIDPFFPELGDALDGFEAKALEEVEKAEMIRSMKVAARLLTCKSPAEAVVRHKADLSFKVIETLQLAAGSARANGNSAYSDRLATYADAVKNELVT